MQDYTSVILGVRLTEKTNDLVQDGTYTVIASKRSTKIDIRIAMEKLFGVKVKRVNTVNVLGKKKRMGVHIGRQSSYKKAYVTIELNPSDKKYKTVIDAFGVAQ